MIDAGWARKTINRQIQRICRAFRWAVENELCDVAVYQRLKAVDGLRRGMSEARETTPIGPVPEPVVEATIRHVSPVVADMIRFQRLTGCRPMEVCLIRPCDVVRSGDVWRYTPSTHKTEHHDRSRVIFIGPKAQKVLEPYLGKAAEAFCFSPSESECGRRLAAHARRKTPIAHGNRPGTNRKKKPKRTAGTHYHSASYRRAIDRAVDKENAERRKNAKPGEEVTLLEYWAPNRLRHSAATEIRRLYGIEGSQVVLGHAGLNVTELYAERDAEKAVAIMRAIG
jgi:integrase